jgi:preprotein translocase subunit SecE
MASKVLVNGEERPAPVKVKRQGSSSGPTMVDKFAGTWNRFTSFLTDVRAEMRKVVAPGRKEVEITTWVVIVAVFLFGLFFFIVDFFFRIGIDQILHRFGGYQ